jgi:SOS response associated peptidase (SRAP)
MWLRRPFSRCLVPADAFYEWQKLDAKIKQPFAIALKSNEPYAFLPLRQVTFAGLPRLRSSLAHAITKSFLSGSPAVIWDSDRARSSGPITGRLLIEPSALSSAKRD